MLKNAAKGVLATLILLLFAAPVFAQYTAKETKAIQKSKDLFNKGKYDKAVSTIKTVQNAHLYDDDLWNLRCVYEYQRYNVQLINDLIMILKGKSKTKFKSTEYYTEMMVACYSATLLCEKQDFASSVLHGEKIEPSTDTTISDDAKEQYGKGGDEYSNQNYSGAIRYYEKALKEDSTYYKATYKLAMCYYKDEQYEKAIPYFQKAIRLQPEMLDPRLNLVESFMKEKQWQDAYNACVDGIVHYPDNGYFMKLETICDKMGKTFNRHWMSRDYLPNMVNNDAQSSVTEEPWSYYRDAKNKMIDYCNEDGIIKKSQDLTQQKYLEAYSWEYMLKKSTSDSKEFGFARKMKDEGFLDCYAMVSMFHITIWSQYKDFSAKNADRIRKYIDTYLVK